jgi:signal transduction histidine kinase
MERTALESEAVSQKARWAMILLGILGPLSGLISGYGIARGLSRSISRLIVRLQDVRAHLDQDVGSIKLARGKRPVDLDAQLDHVVARVREVAEQAQQHQREILRAEQLAAVGQLAASVAHEVRNPLTGIKLLVGATINARNHPPLTLDDLQVIHGEINRMEHTVQGLLDFARPRAVQRSESDLREVVTQALDLVRSRANQQRVEIRTALPDRPLLVWVDRDQLADVLVNLLMNALDALPQGGVVDVKLSEEQTGGVCLSVRDSGPGLSADILAKLFIPFVSSKPTGTGLGLSVCRRIVEGHGGSVIGRNAPGAGAEFIITLPTHVEEESRAAAPVGHR